MCSLVMNLFSRDIMCLVMPNLFSAVQIIHPLILQKHRMDIALMYLLVFCRCLDHNCLFQVFVAGMQRTIVLMTYYKKKSCM